jgi:DNA repair protein RadB
MFQTTSKELTEFLQPGKSPILVYGEAATGKTCLCLMAAIEAAKKGKVIYIDTEGGFNTERISQICPDFEGYLGNIFLIRARSFKEQHAIMQNLEKTPNVSLIVLDTLGNHFRALFRNHRELAEGCLKKQLVLLSKKAEEGVNVLIATQVYTDLKSGRIEPIGGNLLKSFCEEALFLNQKKITRSPIREIVMEKPERKRNNFEIQNSGICMKIRL